MEKTPEEKREAAAALLKEGQQEIASGQAKVTIAERDMRMASNDKPKVTQPPFYPKPPKRTRFTPTQICSKTSPVEAEEMFKKLGQQDAGKGR